MKAPRSLPPSMRHPNQASVTTDMALNIARLLKYGPRGLKSHPAPSLDEAIDLIQKHRASCSFNWKTGQLAEEVLRMSKGEEIAIL